MSRMASPYLTVTESQDFPDIEIKCSESVTFGENARKRIDKAKRELQRECILNGVCALLNSGGGVMTVDVANSLYDYKKEARGEDLEQHLKMLVGSQIEDMIEFIPQGDKVYIYVRSWHSGEHRPRLCSINTGLWERTGSNNERILPSMVSELLEKKKNRVKDEGYSPAKKYAVALPGNDIIKLKAGEFYMRDSVNSGEHLEFGESLHVEFKQFDSCDKLDTRLKEVVAKNISAFANTDGGFMFIGINDKTQKVIGCGHMIEEVELLRMVKELCERPKAVHVSGCSKKTYWSPEYKLLKVKAGKSSEAGGYVVAIKIPAFCCAVFEKDPNCWHIQSGAVCRLDADAWLEKMQLTDPDGDLCKRFQNVVSLQNAPPLCKPVYSIQTLTQLQEKHFPVPENGVSVVPEASGDKFTSVGHLTDSLRGPGVCIVSHSWAVDLNLPKNEGVMYEALIINKGSYPTLCCVVETASPELWKYTRDTAFQLKQRLVNVGGYSGKLCVIPQLVVPGKSPVMLPNVLYPNSYRLKQESYLSTLLHSLVVVVWGFTSALSDELGCAYLNLLTEEQFKILQNFGGIKNLFIHGVPGSGKTLIAMEQIRRIKNLYGCGEKNILYLCENVGLRDFVRKQNICQCETRAKFMSPHMDFSEVQHVIVDEAQNFRMEDGNWYEKAQGLVDEDGMFWVFLDYYQKNHNFPDGLPRLASQNRVVLHKVVRNSAKILDAMEHQMAKVVDGPPSPVTKHLAGMHKKMELSHSFPGTFLCREVPPNKVMSHVTNILQHLFSQGYSPGDIAVLFPTQQHLDAEMFNIGAKYPFSSVNYMNSKEIVLDTVRRFSGLERNIVILVNPSVHPFFGANEPNFLISAYSRARIRLFHVKIKVPTGS